jgi:hypothetical protein
LFAGRIVSFLSFLALAPNVYLISSKNSASRTTGVVSSLFFVSLMGAYYHFYIAMNDPQMLDNALMLAGLTVFVLKPRRVPYLLPVAGLVCLGGFVKQSLIPIPLTITIFLVAGLVCLGGFVKQSLIPIPLTITIFLTLFDRGALLLWLAASVVCLAAAFAVILELFEVSRRLRAIRINSVASCPWRRSMTAARAAMRARSAALEMTKGEVYPDEAKNNRKWLRGSEITR